MLNNTSTYVIRRLIPTVLLTFFIAGSSFAQPAKKKDTREYQVVINHEEQYGIWLAGEEAPKGWSPVGDSWLFEGCYKFIDKEWTDMRPLSLRKIMTAEKLDPEKSRYSVVINHEEQYSMWLADREAPDGWKSVGFQGSKKESTKYIKKVWTDMRPLSLRKRLEKMDKG